jgi:hypothetical protein
MKSASYQIEIAMISYINVRHISHDSGRYGRVQINQTLKFKMSLQFNQLH